MTADLVAAAAQDIGEGKMMGFATTSVAPEHGENGSSCLSVRSNLNVFGAIASASTLALGLVAVPPDFNGATTGVRAVQLTTLVSAAR